MLWKILLNVSPIQKVINWWFREAKFQSDRSDVYMKEDFIRSEGRAWLFHRIKQKCHKNTPAEIITHSIRKVFPFLWKRIRKICELGLVKGHCPTVNSKDKSMVPKQLYTGVSVQTCICSTGGHSFNKSRCLSSIFTGWPAFNSITAADTDLIRNH